MINNRMETLAIIPIRGNYLNMDSQPRIMLNKKPLLSYTIEAVKKSALINRIIVSTDSPAVAEFAKELGAQVPFVRPAKFAKSYTSLGTVLKHAVLTLQEKEGYSPDVIALLEVGYPFRDDTIINKVISTLCERNLDTAFVGLRDQSNYWRVTDKEELELLTPEIDVPRQYKKNLYREMRGLVLATKTEFIRQGELRGNKVGLIPLEDKIVSFHIVSTFDLKIAELLSKNIPILKNE